MILFLLKKTANGVPAFVFTGQIGNCSSTLLVKELQGWVITLFTSIGFWHIVGNPSCGDLNLSPILPSDD